LFCLPHIGQDTITTEDIKFREYLERKGWDTRQLGLNKGESIESRAEANAQSLSVAPEIEEKKL
jgi:hypothetical protein